MRNNPATSDQRKFAESLGVELPLGATVEEASELIRFAPASEHQRLLATEVGIKLPTQITYQEAKRLLSAAYTQAGRRTIAKMKIKVGDLLLKEGTLWQVKNIFKGYRISLKPVRPIKCGHQFELTPTGEPGKVFNAFTFRDATRVDPQTLQF